MINITTLGRYFLNGSFTNWWSADTVGNWTNRLNCFKDYYQAQKAGPYLVDGVNETVSLSSLASTF